MVALVASVVVSPLSSPQRIAHAAAPVEISAWAPYYQVNDALASFNAHRSSMGALNAFFYTATGAATIGFDASMSSSQKLVASSYKAAASESGKPLIATISDAMKPREMASILADPGSRAMHVQALLTFAMTNGFAGIDINYENFAYNDGDASWPATFTAWGQFVTELSAALHANSLRLEVSVPPIYDGGHTQGSGYWVYNYPVMAQAVDRVKVMAYNYSSELPGPIAPYSWVSNSIDAALQIVPAGKLVLGIPAYGKDWRTKISGSCPIEPKTNQPLVPPKRLTVETRHAAQRAADTGQIPDTDAARRERTFSYVESFAGVDGANNPVRCNVTRTVWYLDAEAIHHRVALAQSKGLVGVALWAGGYEDAATWTGIEAARAGQPFSAPAPIPPNVKAPAVVPPYPMPLPFSGNLPARFLDTRVGAQYTTVDGQSVGGGVQAAGSDLRLQIAGRWAVPATASAVTLNVTVLGKATGFVTVYPCGALPQTSNLNVLAGQTIANTVITKLSANGSVCIYTQQPADLVVDVFNVLPDSTITALDAPARLLDTRPGRPTVDGPSADRGPRAINDEVVVQVAGRGGVSETARTAVLNVTAVDAQGRGFLTLWPCDRPRPATSNVNYADASTTPNAVITALSNTGTVCVYSSNVTDVIVDVSGELGPDAYDALDESSRLLDTRNTGPGPRQHNDTEVQVGDSASPAANQEAVVLNVTATEPTVAGYITIYPCGEPRPNASNLNFVPGQTVPNLVISRVSTTGSVCVFTSSPTHVVVDVFGSLGL